MNSTRMSAPTLVSRRRRVSGWVLAGALAVGWFGTAGAASHMEGHAHDHASGTDMKKGSGGMAMKPGPVHTITASLPEARVTVKVPRQVALESQLPLDFSVTPLEGQPAPERVRARLGMPEHGHWVSEEAAYDFHGQSHLSFPGNFPMTGVYRFRIWIDYPGNTGTKTAVDFMLPSSGTVSEVQVVE